MKKIKSVVLISFLFLLIPTGSYSDDSSISKKWIDRTLPPGMTFEEFKKLDQEFKNLPESLKKPAKPAVTYAVGDQEYFWTYSHGDNAWHQTLAECRTVSTYAYVFVALNDNYNNDIWLNGSNNGYITQNDVDSISSEFNGIYTTDRDVFGNEPTTGLNEESKIVLLLLDIDDSFHFDPTSVNNYIAGYFDPADRFTDSVAQDYNRHSNECKILYLDTYPRIQNISFHDISKTYNTIAHEFQHMIHDYHDPYEELWVNEGCSSLAEYVCGYDLRTPDNFKSTTDDPLTNWNSQLIDYEQVALFFLYLYERYGGATTINQIVSNSGVSISGINSVLVARGYSERFYAIFDDWCVANYLDDTSIYDGRYGYLGINLSGYPFSLTYSHSSYPVNNSGYVSDDSFEYIKFSNGYPLTLYYSHNYGLNGFLIKKGSGPATIVTISKTGVFSPDFGSTTTEIILVANAHEYSSTYGYISNLDSYEPNNSRETAYTINFTNNSWASTNAEITFNDDQDWFTFNGEEGDRVSILCDVTSDLDAEIVLYRNNTKHTGKNDGVSGADESITDYVLPSAGTYYVGVGYSPYIAKTVKIAANTGTYQLTINRIQTLEPPSNFIVSDVLNDNGHFLKLEWIKSPSEDNGLVSFYRIYRSRNETLTDPIPLTQFTSIDSLNYYEQFYTILRDSVTAGIYEYTDFVPINGAPYTYWLQAVGNGEASQKIRSGLPTIVKDNRPLQFVVNAPYPNPFNPATTLSFVVPTDSHLELTIYNIIGEKVETLTDEYVSAGFYSFTWTPKDMPSGIYFFRINMGDNVDVKKVVLLK